MLFSRSARTLALLWLTLPSAIVPSLAVAQEACGLCAKAIVTNSSLADCFLQQFGALSRQSNGAIAVDLSACPEERGVVEALPTPNSAPLEDPDIQFMLSRPQLDCLKGKLEEPGLVLDPQARIALDSCG